MSKDSSETSLKQPIKGEIVMPLKGFKAEYPHPDLPEGSLIEGMGDGRYRIHVKFTQKGI
jgi:hypothetical protein